MSTSLSIVCQHVLVMATSSIPIPKISSRYLPPIIRLDDLEDDEEEDSFEIREEFCQTSTSFVVDKMPSTTPDEQSSPPSSSKDKDIKLSSSLNPGVTLKGYLPNGVKETLEFMSKSMEAEKIFQEKCVLLREGFHTDMSINPKIQSRRKAKLQRKKEREATAGSNWYDMPAQEITPELEQDIDMINMRDALDRKRFYKRNSGLKNVKYLQVGTIIGSKADFYNDLTRRQKKRNLVEELMNEKEVKEWHKKKFVEIVKTNPHYLKIRRKMENAKKKRKSEERERENQLIMKKKLIKLRQEQKKKGIPSLFDKVRSKVQKRQLKK